MSSETPAPILASTIDQAAEIVVPQTNGIIATVTSPAVEATPAPPEGIVHQSIPIDQLDLDADEPPPIIRMRNTAANMNGQQQDADLHQATLNGHAALHRGLEALAGTETSQNIEEIKKLDSQLDHFNKYLDKFEKKNNELTDRLTGLLKTQKEERVKRRASFMQKEEELKAEQDTFENQLKQMFAKCAQMRRASAAPVLDSSVPLDYNRRIRENANEMPIHENGHEETEATAN